MATNSWSKAAKKASKENMPSSKGKFLRKRGSGRGSGRLSLHSSKSQDSRILVDVEEEFLHAAEFGDIPTVRRLLGDNPDLNVDCIDALGRTALRLAVKNEHLEVVEVLLEKSSSRHIYEAVLQAISAGHVQIAENILKHKRYLELWKERKKLGDDDHFFKTQFEESQFSPDITPLILASQKNQYEIVQILLLRGEKIQNPHKFGCMCRECVNKMKFDQLRSAKYRLNAYRGLASEAYISLSSKDPILTAFQLSKELKELSSSEKYFKLEYKELRNQLSEYVVKLLDRVRNQDELETVLNKSGKPDEETYSNLARLSLALQFMEKKFVAHPGCQQRLDKSWYEGIGPFLKAGLLMRILMILSFIVAYPFLALCYIFLPNSKIKFLRVLQFPWIKFVVHSASYIIFLILIIVTTTEATYLRTQNATLAMDYSAAHSKYTQFQNYTNLHLFGEDIPIRQSFPTTTQMLILLWIFGFLYHECCQITSEGLSAYCRSMYNLVDSMLLLLYACSFTLKYLVMFKVHIGIDYFNKNSVEDIISRVDDSKYNLYWITADRYYWDKWDPVHLSEGLFAIANILGFSRISYLLPANEALGPLQISLGRMLKDIFKCLCLLSLVLCAFVIGLQNLYWYYNARESIELETRSFEVPAQESFGDTVKAFRTVFWSLFGRGESTAVTLGDYNNNLTEDIGYMIYGLYNVVMVTVLINMLIAMMARSFQAIAEESDVEWKFARSQLYMEYISEEEVLPVPLNLARIPRSVIEWIFDCRTEEKSTEAPDDTQNIYDIDNGASSPGIPITRNGADHMTHISQIATHMRAIHSISSNSSMDYSAVDMYEGNKGAPHLSRTNSEITKRHRQSIPGMLDSNKGYQKVMQRIIQRYIFDIQREAEVTEDDFEEIKQDISSFRYEMLSFTRNREQEMTDVNNQLAKLTSAILGTSQTTEDNEQQGTPSNKFQAKALQLRNRIKSQGSRASLLESQSPSEDLEDGYETGEKDTDRSTSDPDLKTISDTCARTPDSEPDGTVSDAPDDVLNTPYASPVYAGDSVEPARTSDDEECFVVDNHEDKLDD